MSGQTKERELLSLTFIKLKKIFHITGTRYRYFIPPLFLGLLAAGFEAISASLLIPLAQGVISMNFSSLRVNFILKLLPKNIHTFADSGAFMFGLLVGIVFSAALLKNAMQYLSTLSIAYQLRKFSNALRKAVFERYLNFGKLFFDRNNIGHLKYMLTSSNGLIIEELINLHTIFSTAFMFIVYIIIMFAISWKLTLLMISIFPLLNFSIRWLITKIRQTSTPYIKSQFYLNDKLNNLLSCLNLVKAYAREKKEKKSFNKASDVVAEWEFSMDKKIRLTEPFQEIIVLIAILLLLVLMAFMVAKGEAHRISSFLVYFYILRRAERGFAIPNRLKASLARISGPVEELSDIFSEKDKFYVSSGNKTFTELKKGFEFRNLNFAYGQGKQVLKELSFSINKGEMTAIVGPTGSGKTTIINLLMRFYECPDSSIFIDGCDIKEFSLDSLRWKMALVSQDTLLFNDTLRENIIYGIEEAIDDNVLMELAKKARLYDFILGLPEGLDTKVGDRGVQLSGGEKQRVSIMRALLKNTEVLILDEATSSLDTGTERLIQGAIEAVVKGRTTIVIAHRLSTIQNTDKILVIEEGRLIEQGPLGYLLEQEGHFYKYWQEQKFF